MKCIFHRCAARPHLMSLPFGGRMVWVCQRHRGWAVLARLAELIA